ncbi:UDP-N-acetylmuramoyl-L-alanyl-D-glutamate--2,6-diaminopimelate ligase [Undibacterium sp. CY21W]|uniref:UDP-N-acetylmuramoyl-L-alanyl-D-glutamate--2, 6-diaminopimelate ligase n=1 Tax=Undibacterium sp. CY21W TaxID=2762293 RepID=UPI00164CB6C7|nr:UDP-N-acetylmuramoyl-L-alanyl-D-glutamate--2,6-diaminopimelate ligase [Undibacterium sp. CY21W]MBC3927239.1 UDP-N-acetylmuramoyl-L-alanyl-D-glutamate--2,6-diaminopimelate ligase [Undibacterium sp. CY21W]
MTNKKISINEIVNWLRQVAPDAQLCSNSAKILTGDVFFAARTHHGDGRKYIPDALARGAIAVIYDVADGDTFVWDESISVPHFAVPDLSQQLGLIANEWYGNPDRAMFSVAVTGTNGKTSCSQWLAKALSMEKCDTAVIGTLGTGIYHQGVLGQLSETGFTTPDAISLQRELSVMQKNGAEALAIEASSIGLDQGRLNGLHIDVALFTNLTRDHLDYHGDMDAYAAAKQRLFDWNSLTTAIINLDDVFGLQLLAYLQQARPDVRLMTYSLEKSSYEGTALLSASNLKTTHAGTSFHLESPLGSGLVKTQLIGRFNVSNILGVLAVLLSKGIPLPKALALIEKLPPVPGRMQLAGSAGHVMVVIDYAHTPDALEKTLEALRLVADERGGQLWCVFGCGGDRDPGKRPQMGRISEQADHVIVTSDNPRSEDPAHIIGQIVAGMSKTPHIIEDRANAILYAIKHAGDQDVVLLAGKGHETYQDINGKKWPFSDEEHAALALATVATSGNMKRGI